MWFPTIRLRYDLENIPGNYAVISDSHERCYTEDILSKMTSLHPTSDYWSSTSSAFPTLEETLVHIRLAPSFDYLHIDKKTRVYELVKGSGWIQVIGVKSSCGRDRTFFFQLCIRWKPVRCHACVLRSSWIYEYESILESCWTSTAPHREVFLRKYLRWQNNIEIRFLRLTLTSLLQDDSSCLNAEILSELSKVAEIGRKLVWPFEMKINSEIRNSLHCAHTDG